MSSPHCLDKPFEYNQNCFLLQDSHPNSMSLTDLFQRFQGFQEYSFEFDDPIYDWLEEFYLKSTFANKNLRSYLMFSKQDNMDESAFTISFQGLSLFSSNRRGKVVGQLSLVSMMDLSNNIKYLISSVEVIQVLLFSFAHDFILVLIICIFVIIDQEQL